MNLPSCCFCREPLLELRGQFQCLPAYLLLPTDDELRAANALGDAHLTCLLTSGFGPTWSERSLGHARSVLRLAAVGERDGAIALRNPNMRETQIFWTDGRWTAVQDRLLDTAEPTEGGVLLRLDEEYNMEFSPHRAVVEEIRAALVAEGRYPLGRLVEHLGVSDRVAHPDALARGALVLDAELRELWEGDWVSARVRYHEFLPQEGYSLALEGARYGVSVPRHSDG